MRANIYPLLLIRGYSQITFAILDYFEELDMTELGVSEGLQSSHIWNLRDNEILEKIFSGTTVLNFLERYL